MKNNYTDPVSKLLKLGRPDDVWLDYLAIGITNEHISELIRLMEDGELRFENPPDDFPEDEDLPEWYAQIHAWRALGQLRAEQAIPAILGILHQVDDEEDDDWLSSDLGEVFTLIGAASVSPLGEYLLNDQNGLYPRMEAASALVSIAKEHLETRNESIGFLVSALEKHKENDEILNGFLIYDLALLKAVEHIDLIEKVFASKNVDELIMGDFEDVQIEMGLRENRTKPRKGQSLFHDAEENVFVPEIKSKDQKKKDKDKRKQEKKSRKKNRKKK